jgi:4-hydroxybenzoyl-CoA thioesterase
VRALQVLVFTSLDSHRAIAMPPDVRQALAAFTQPLDATTSSQDVL